MKHLISREGYINEYFRVSKNIEHDNELFDIIVKKAKELKEKAQKERDAEAAKAQQESEANEKK